MTFDIRYQWLAIVLVLGDPYLKAVDIYDNAIHRHLSRMCSLLYLLGVDYATKCLWCVRDCSRRTNVQFMCEWNFCAGC